LPDFVLRWTIGSRGRLHGSKHRQDDVLTFSAGPFVSMVHNVALRTRKFTTIIEKDFFNSLSQKRTSINQNEPIAVDCHCPYSYVEAVPDHKLYKKSL
jgi:hypothetical protein